MRLALLVVAGGCTSEPAEVDPVARAGPRRAVTAHGEVTWSATFDADAATSGLQDCSYTRTYSGVEDRSTPWLCPECDLVLLADVAMSEEDRACYRSITGVEPAAQERIGWSADRFFRTTYAFGPMVEAGSIDAGADPHERVSFVDDVAEIALTAGSMALTSSGDLTVGLTAADPWHGMLPASDSACGWPRSNLDAWTGAWEIEVGRQLPDGWFGDACGDPVRLHDLSGRYLVVSVSAMDCGPCQAMAAEEERFAADVRALGVAFASVTLLAPSLEAPVDPTPTRDLALWAGTFDLEEPVLGDRGWGYAMATSVWPDSMSYPSWFVTTPSLEVVAAGQGYDGWQGAWRAITDHRSGR